MLSSCVVAFLMLALTQGMPEAPQRDGVYVPQESTYEMGMPPALHRPDGMAGMPENELKPRAEFKQKMSKRRESNDVDFPNPAQLFPFHFVAADEPTHELGQQDAEVQPPMDKFVQQPGGPNGPAGHLQNARRPRVQFPSPSQMKPFQFGPQHNARVQHMTGANAFVGQDAPQPQFDNDMRTPEAPMLFPFHFAPRDDADMQQQQQQQQQWMADVPPQPQPYDDEPEMPHWAMQAPPPLHPFPPMFADVPPMYGDMPPMYDDEQPPFGNSIEDAPMDDMPPFEYDEAPMRPPFRPSFPRARAPWGRWNRHRFNRW